MKNKLYLLLFLSGIQFSTLYAQPGLPDLSNGPSWEKPQHALTPGRFYVDKDAAAGNNTGQSWENAFTDLQQALFLAEPGDTIWVAEGTYYPTPGEERTASFSLKQGVAMYGGFAATEASLAIRNLWGQFNTSIKNCTFFNNGRYAIAKSWGEVYNDSTWYNNLEISNSILWEEDTQLPGLQSIFYNGDPDAPSLYDYRISHTALELTKGHPFL